MKLVISSDYSGFPLKEAIRKHLIASGHEVTDVGPKTADDKLPYVDATCNLVKEFRAGGYTRGVICCGTGAGVSILANKHKGIYCIASESMYTADRCAIINDANVLAMGNNVVGPDNACRMVDAWLANSFVKGIEGERKEWLTSLLEKLKKVEAENMK